MDFTLGNALVLGFIQGLTEFLPISSSGHLVLVPWMFGFNDPGLGFSAAIHLGTLAAVVYYFWRDWIDILGFKKKEDSLYTKDTLKILVVSTLPAVFVGYFFASYAATLARSPVIVAFLIALSGLVLWIMEYWIKKRTIKNLTMRDALTIGCAQALALLPGVSRSGITMATGMYLGLTKEAAARFSFLMATPVILGAGLLSFLQNGFSNHALGGIVISFIIAYLTIHTFLAFIQKIQYKYFFYYSLLLGGIIIFLAN